MTPARSETAAKVLFAIPATKWTAEGIYVLLRLSRDYWWWWLGSGWPELTAASSAAAAGVRVRSGSVLQGVWGGVGAFYVLLVMCGARWCARLGATVTRAMQRGWVVRGELGRAMLTSLPALARGSSWLARASTVLGRLGWAGRSR